MKDSVEGEGNILIDDNTLLREESQEWDRNGFAFYPMITINNQTYRGDIEAEAVLIAICAGFKSPPDWCEAYIEMNSDSSSSDDDRAFYSWLIVIIVVVVLVIILSLVFLYRLWLRNELYS
jgi:hypothetical protein